MGLNYSSFISTLKSEFPSYANQIDNLNLGNVRLDAVFSRIPSNTSTPAGALNSNGTINSTRSEVYLTLGERYSGPGTNVPVYRDPSAVKFNSSTPRYTTYDTQTVRVISVNQYWNGICGVPEWSSNTLNNFVNYFDIRILPDGTDTNPPTLSYTPNSSNWGNTNVTVTINATDDLKVDLVTYKYYKQGQSASAPLLKGNDGTKITLNETGIWEITGTAYDLSGHSTSRTSGLYKIDKVLPTVSAIPASRAWGNTNASTSITVSDSLSGINDVWIIKDGSSSMPADSDQRWLKKGATVGSSSYNFSESFSGEGNNYVHVWARDVAGNIIRQTFGPYRIDKTEPKLEADPSSRDWGNTDASTSITVSDSLSGVNDVWIIKDGSSSMPEDSDARWLKKGATVGSSSYNFSESFSSTGDNYIHVWARDVAGNITRQTFSPYRVDKIKPSGLFDPNESDWVTSIETTFFPSDEGGSGVNQWRYRLKEADSDWEPWSNFITGQSNKAIFLNVAGKWIIEAEITDNAGNVDCVTSGVFHINTPPILTAYYPSIVFEGDNVKISLLPEDPDDQKLSLNMKMKKDGGEWIEVLNMDDVISGLLIDYHIPNIDSGFYEFEATATDPTMAFASVEFNFSVTPLEVIGEVHHTEKWNSNRIQYNRSKSGTDDLPRTYDVFFPGEKFVLAATTNNQLMADRVHVEVVGESFSTFLNSENGIQWEGEIWDESMFYWDDREVSFIFTAYYPNNFISVHEVTVYILDDKYYKLHRQF